MVDLPLIGQTFSHIDANGVQRVFSIPFLERHRARHPNDWELLPIDIDRATMRFFLRERGVNLDVARKISLQRMEEPGIACWMADGSGLVVDGSHRLVKRVLQGCRVMVLWMCHEDVWAQSLVRYNGQDAYIPY